MKTALIIGDLQRGVTGAMVAATCYDAADRDYRVTVLRDGCADGDHAVREFFMDKVFPSRAHEVVSCARWLAD
jgi:nicotinamidase-related amidase